MRCDALSSNWVRHLALFCSLSYCLVPLLPLCLLSQHCWFRVVSCGRVVSLWNSGGGLCWVEGRVVSTVHC